ncbi:uncharacterized protein F5891DRAFT_1184017 [Suillus fuscotomentosus]|uniref:DRBM domain-containing protein n=1 Tax=Suillus fuscotomentosus TaxID=1912939 RepID=A0AAD4EGJ3_9AGAM|nr:uncharacterized protein F5891DRAFT_1184017 [Suillus fuscotomentosus]KAG1904594.1 hypothetical protein F5891DRAFT_1184017 [Suillus fuscotomentosus]
MSGNDHPRMRLNNELQRIYGPSAPNHVRWEVYSEGPPNASTWYATIFVDDQNYSYASAPTRGAAQDAAAQQACERLRRDGSTGSN